MRTTAPQLLFLVTVLVTFQHPAYALSDSQTQSIIRLGELNGIALHCKHLKSARHIKLSLAESLPRLRGLGEMFEDETNRSFLEFINSGDSCPGEATIREKVDQAISIMKQQFHKPE
ncbi:MAG: hypothetical protein OQK78_03815 [Gammaproteobacteria bacterium]|nr:hypothetical protein [Gammaproteobacteria bacterium]